MQDVTILRFACTFEECNNRTYSALVLMIQLLQASIEDRREVSYLTIDPLEITYEV